MSACATSVDVNLVQFRGQHKVAFRQAIDLMGENCRLDPAPGEEKIRMMALFYGHSAGAVDEIESGFESRKKKTRKRW